MYYLKLADGFELCPVEWQNFVSDAWDKHNMHSGDFYTDKEVDIMLNDELEQYNAVFITDDTVEFKSKEDAMLFKLTWA